MIISGIDAFQAEGLSDSENIQVSNRIQKILSEWEGTPYAAGWQAKGAGVDCVRFVAGVLDELQGHHTELERLPQDASFHNKELCIRGMRGFLSRYPHTKVESTMLQPGDVIVAGPRGGGPGHAILAGVRSLWHCDSSCVSPTGFTQREQDTFIFHSVYRVANREAWLK